MKISSTLSLIAALFLFTNLYAQDTYNKIDSITSIYKLLIHNNNKEKLPLSASYTKTIKSNTGEKQLLHKIYTNLYPTNPFIRKAS